LIGIKIIFIAGLKFGYECLKALCEHNMIIDAVFTLSTKYKNRSGYISFDNIKKYGVPVYEVDNINDAENVEIIKQLNPDIIFIAGWSFLIGKEILSIPKLGCIGQHPSLLPKHRGNAPIPWAIIMGLTKTGTTLFYLSDNVDSGDIVGQKEIRINLEDNAEILYEKITQSTIELYLEIIPKLKDRTAPRIPQDEKRSYVMPKRTPQDGIIDWDKISISLYNWIRGLSKPYPGAFTFLGEDKIFVWNAKYLKNNSYNGIIYNADHSFKPGEIIEIMEEGLIVATGDGAIFLNELQKDGEIEMDFSDFVKLKSIKKGMTFY